MPPVPVVVEYTSVHAVPSGDTWILNALPYAASQVSTTWLIDAEAPRSTWSHCGSLKALAQRVPVVFPSKAAEAGVPAFSVEEAVAALPWDSRLSTAMAGAVTARPDAINTTRKAMSRPMRYRPGLRESCTASP